MSPAITTATTGKLAGAGIGSAGCTEADCSGRLEAAGRGVCVSALDMATRHGAAAIHDPLAGRLEPGSRADFFALDLRTPNLQPVHSVVSNVVYAATGLENRLTVCDGRELYRDGRFLSLDFDALLAEAESLRRWAAG